MKTAYRLKKALAFFGTITLMATSVTQANAAILFQNDAEFEMDSDNLVIDFDDTTRTTGDVYIDFGNSSNAENGRITWSMDDERFEFTQDVNFLAGSQFDASAADGFRIRENATDLNGPTGLFCTNENELAFRTDTNELFYCDQIGTQNDVVETFDYAATATVLTNGTTAGLIVGQTLTGTDIAPGTTIVSIDSATQITISLATTNVAPVVAGSITFEEANWELVVATANSATASSIVTYANDAAANAGFGTPVEGDVYYNTTNDQIMVHNGTSWVPAGPQDFEDIFAFDGDGTLTTGNSNFTTNAGTGDLSFTSDLFDVNAGDLDIDTTGTVDINAGTTMALTSTNWSINTDGDASLVDITATGAVNLTGASSVQIKEVADITALNALDCLSTGELVFVVSTNTVYVCTNAGTDTFTVVGGSAGKADVLKYNAEYQNAVYYEDGTANKGTLEALFDNAANRHYYNYRSTQAAQQDLDLVFKFNVPEDYSDFATDWEVDYQTIDGGGDAANAQVDVEVLDGATSCFTSNDNFSDDVWDTITLTAATITTNCTAIAPGNALTIRFKLHARSGGFVSQLGQIRIPYTN